MQSSLKVFKFGGASLKDAEGIRHVGTILQGFKDETLVVVLSASAKTTNHLEEVVNAYFDQSGDIEAKLAIVRNHHQKILEDLFPQGHEVFSKVNDTFVEIDWIIEDEVHDTYDYIYDQIVSIGEMLSSDIVNAYLNSIGLKSQFLDARDVIRTDETWREGWVIWPDTEALMIEKVKPMLSNGGFVVTQGFIGGTKDNQTTTLGREGSDFTAAIFSYCLDASGMYIWKDVAGVLTGDPRIFDQVTKIDRMSYKEAIEMTYYGAKVIHPKTIKPLQNKNIPLYVKSFLNPEGSGTMVSEMEEPSYPPVVVVEGNQALLMISTRDFSFVAEHHLAKLFELFAEHRLMVNMMLNTAISFSVVVPYVKNRIEALSRIIEDEFSIVVEPGLELITVRHYLEDTISDLKSNKIVLLEERLPKTCQFVVKDAPRMIRKDA
ncbi:MAG: aspartate kinase [Saprospiraceae bacterium]